MAGINLLLCPLNQGYIAVIASKNGTAVGGAGIQLSATSIYKEFVAPIFYTGPSVDSIYISIGTDGSTIGSALIIDALSFGAVTSVND
jgi:hypothetical protein